MEKNRQHAIMPFVGVQIKKVTEFIGLSFYLKGNKNVVEIQDLVFAGHAVVLSTMTASQIFMCGYERGGQRVSWPIIVFVILVAVLTVVYGGFCSAHDDKVRSEVLQ